MKKRVFCGLLALCMLLSGCSSMLNRQYASVTPHSVTPAADGDPSVLRVERYQELVNALVYLISLGRESGSVRLYMDSDAVEQSLEDACLEVVQKDPLGAYAVDFITYSLTPSVSCYQADLQIAYRRTADQIASIISATGATAIRGALKTALSQFSQEAVLRISYFVEDEDYIRELVAEAFYSAPLTAIDLPDAAVSIYPDSGRQRIVEVLLSYHSPQSVLEERSAALKVKAEELTSLLGTRLGDQKILSAAAQVLAQGGYQPENGYTAYQALLGGGADSSGLALALALLCQELEVPCQVVRGTLEGESRCWNVVQTETGYQHIDLAAGVVGAESFFSDQELEAMGYDWDRNSTPPCALREGRPPVAGAEQAGLS